MNNEMMKELGAEEVLWDLGDLYQGIDDSVIHDDMEKCKKSALKIADKYSGKIAELTAFQGHQRRKLTGNRLPVCVHERKPADIFDLASFETHATGYGLCLAGHSHGFAYR